MYACRVSSTDLSDTVGMAADAAEPISWAQLPDDVLTACLRLNYTTARTPNDVREFLRPAAACRSWREVASSNELWSHACASRWPETSSLTNVASFKALWRRMSKADRRVALREPPSELQFMVRLSMRYLETPVDGVDEAGDELVLAHTFKWSEMQTNGMWECPPLKLSSEMLARAACDIESNDLTSFKGFFEWFHATLTVTAFRELDGRITRMLPQTTTELPSPYCFEEDYAGCATFTGFEERVANQSIVLGAQFMPQTDFPDASEMMVNVRTSSSASDGEDEESGEESFYRWNVERLESFLTGLQLRLGYWPTTSFNDPSARHIDWQGCFERSSSDKLGFATFVHCLLDGGAEYAWLSPNDDTPGE